MERRRQLLGWCLGASGLTVLGCGGTARRKPSSTPPTGSLGGALSPADRRLLAAPGVLPIVQRTAGGRGVLRSRARPITAADQPHLAPLDRHLRATLDSSGGVGLAAPQVGISARVVLVMLDARGDTPHVETFVNPRLVERSDEIALDYEGCLSIQGVCGLVRRNQSVVIEHGASGQAPRRLAVTGFDARIFQHEVDHLDGVLYIDRVEGDLQPMEKLKELREELRKQQAPVACHRSDPRELLL